MSTRLEFPPVNWEAPDFNWPMAQADAQAIGRPFRGEIWDFVAAAPMGKGHGNAGAPFKITTANYLRAPFQAIKSPVVRKVVIKSGVKTLKTFVVEASVAHHCAHGEGDIGFYLADTDAARDHAKSRFWDWFWSIAELAQMRLTLSDRFDDTTKGVYFPGKTLRVWPLNESATQGVNLAMVVLSDAFLAGKTGLIDQMIARTTQYKDVRKILIESQGGVEGDDFDAHWLDTDQRMIHVNCPVCGQTQPWEWERLRPEDHPVESLRGKYAGMKRGDEALVKLEDGEYNESEVLRQTYYECYHCGGAWRDDGEFGATRVALDESVTYVPARRTALPGNVGFSWPQWANRRLRWGDIMLEYLVAKRLQKQRGNLEKLKQWYQKVAAQTWDPKLATVMRRRAQETYDISLSKQDAWRLCMIIDNQQDLMQQWVMVLAVKQNGSVRQLWRGALMGLAECRKKQLEYVDEKGNLLLKDQFVFLDGRYKPEQICRHIVEHKYGHWGNFRGERTWFCWNLMQGGRLEYYSHEAEKDKTRKFIMGDPNVRGYQVDKFYVDILVYPFAATACGERFEASRDGRGAETLFLDRQPGEPPDEHELSHHSQIHSNKLVEVKSWSPRDAKKKYVPVPASAPDHYFHMWRMMEAIKEHWGVDGVYRESGSGNEEGGMKNVEAGQA